MSQLTIDDALTFRDAAMKQVEEHAGSPFMDQAMDYILAYLQRHGPTSGEDLTEACCTAGITPHDNRAFGAVYLKLVKKGLIEKCGLVPRRRGHMTAGGHIWRVRTDVRVERP